MLPSSPGGLEGSWPYRTYPYVGCKDKAFSDIGPAFHTKSFLQATKSTIFAHYNKSIMADTENNIIQINVMQTSMTLGMKLGLYITLVYAIFVLSIYWQPLSILSLPLAIGIPFVAYFLLKRFRDANSPDFFPFPVSWMLSILTFLFAGMISCMAVFLFLKFAKPASLDGMLLAQIETLTQAMQQSAGTVTDSVQVEAMNTQIDTIVKTMEWMCGLSASAFTKLLIEASLTWGNIFSLIIGLLVSKRIRIKQQ